MIRRPPISTRTDTLFPYTTLFRSLVESLNAICGNYRRAGDPIHTRGAIFEMVPDIETVVPPSRGWESGPKLRSADVGRINGEFPSSRLAAEILHDGEDRRSEERRYGKECVRTCKSRWSPYH